METNIPVWELNLGVDSEGMMKQPRQKDPCVERRFMWGEAQSCHSYLPKAERMAKGRGNSHWFLREQAAAGWERCAS